MKVPRPSGGSRQSNGVGKIYVKYDTPDSARKALQALAGRKFADRTVVTTYFSEVSLRKLFVKEAEVNAAIGIFRSKCMVMEQAMHVLSRHDCHLAGCAIAGGGSTLSVFPISFRSVCKWDEDEPCCASAPSIVLRLYCSSSHLHLVHQMQSKFLTQILLECRQESLGR